MPFWVFLYVTCFFPLDSFRIFIPIIIFYDDIPWTVYPFESGNWHPYVLKTSLLFFPPCFLTNILNLHKWFSWFILFSIVHLFFLLVAYDEKYGIFFQLYLGIHLIKFWISAFMQMISDSLFPFCGTLSIPWLTPLSLRGKHIFRVLLYFCIVSIHLKSFSHVLLCSSDYYNEASLKYLTFLCYLVIFKEEVLKILGGIVWEWALSASQLHSRVIGQVSWHFFFVIFPNVILCVLLSRAIGFLKIISRTLAWGQHH